MKGVKDSGGMNMPACNTDGTHDYLQSTEGGSANLAQGHTKTPMMTIPSAPQKAVQANNMKKKRPLGVAR